MYSRLGLHVAGLSVSSFQSFPIQQSGKQRGCCVDSGNKDKAGLQAEASHNEDPASLPPKPPRPDLGAVASFFQAGKSLSDACLRYRTYW